MMKYILILIGMGILVSCTNKTRNTNDLDVRSLLLQQLKNTHNNQEWFVPSIKAIENLSAEQSNRRDSTANHSIGELTSHLIFWNEKHLKAIKGEDLSDFQIESNEVTFKKYKDLEWKTAVQKLDHQQSELEMLIENATPEQIDQWGSAIANLAAHNAYHTGQIIYIRKQNGWWK
ncbi:DinB family protein [Sinomicrobium weinanense]|uniref:DinB family protein n=1 Tax=Sinomicrobium weinanense TaxID=2842200 RepID=A0A926Q2I5_9FLAO|nr:DinB family protein [Sinomicrobium weinanense]MBC9794966.1 DinB family protein [Sinomicrobium weinanense]MBU3125173.1 DinB family protein [Sinomicrobium weinanense]